MQKVDTDGLNPTESPQGRQSISAPLDAEEYSMNYYVLDPGEVFSGSRHAHMDQEESFFVLEGEATFETSQEPTGETETVTVAEGEMIRFDPGEYKQGRNESDETVRALALGTPQESTDIRAAVPCQQCGDSDYMNFVVRDGEPALECPQCDAEIAV